MPRSRRILIPLIVFAVVAVVLAFLYFGSGSNGIVGGPIQASGTVETTETSIATELSGKVTEVLVNQGQSVNAGDPLLRLDDELLQAQHLQAEAALSASQSNLNAAQAGLDLAQTGLDAAETSLQVAEANQKAELLVAQQSLDDLYENAAVARTKAQEAVAVANRAVRDATYQLDNFTVPSNQIGLTAMEAIPVMKTKLDAARKAFDPYRNESSGNATRDDLKEKLDEAQADYDAAIKRLEYETAVDQAQARLDKTKQDLEKVQDGPDPDQVAELEARIAAINTAPDQARAAVAQAQVGVRQAHAKLEQAQDAVAQAQAGLDLINLQLNKLVVYAPSSGIILSRDVEPGEVVQSGASLMTIGKINNLIIKVYLPEDNYGQVKLNDPATITVDSFPGENFLGSVTYIADQAEFTPRNVQTSEGRRTTVFLIEVAVDNQQDRLKPGMPADVCFGCR
jgi:HlyD family secretion protein